MSEQVRFDSATGRWILLVTILGSGLAGIDATVVNVALPAIGESLDADFAGLQWTVTAYTLTLAAFILSGGSLGDRFGRRRVFLVGVVWFALASLLCGLAPGIGTLIAARALQGVGGALLTPGSLAIIQASFVPQDRARAIGAWSGLGGVATAVGPFLGGWLVEHVSWRWVFLVNAPLALLVLLLTLRHVPESRDGDAAPGLDVGGAALGVAALAGLTYALMELPGRGLSDPAVLAAGALAIGAGAGFCLWERRAATPMLPLDIFASRQFTAANLVTFAVYGGFGAVFFLLVIELQVVGGYSPIAAGTSILPITAIMLLLSARSGALAYRIGPRLQMSLGPVVCAVGLLLMRRIGPDASFVADVLPGVAVFGLGLAVMVAPLTATALAAAPSEHAWLASGVNNAVARAAGLVAVAVLPAVSGITGAAYDDATGFDAGFETSLWIAAVVLLVGAVIAAVTIANDHLAPEPEPAADPEAEPAAEHRTTSHCAVGGPPAAVHTRLRSR